jgi:peptide deformylase
MAILKTAKMGHPILRSTAEPVNSTEIDDPGFQELLDDMVETLRDYDGAGLAAPQIHEAVQVVAIEVRPNRRYPEAPTIPLTILINRKVTALTDEQVAGWEGCLSLPDLRGLVPRHRAVEVEALGRNGKPIRFCAEGFFATVVQHEVDHLRGILFPDRMDDLRTLAFISEWERFWRTPAPTPCS